MIGHKTGPPSVPGKGSLGDQTPSRIDGKSSLGDQSSRAVCVSGFRSPMDSTGVPRSDPGDSAGPVDHFFCSPASSSHSFTLRTALRTNGPLACTEPAAAGERVTRHCISNRHPCQLETDDPSRIVVPSDQREPRDLSPLLASRRRSNRHSCRLETTLTPCASTSPPLLIVTETWVFL